MADVMLDLETLGLSPGCVVFAIGAVAFDPVRNTVGTPFFELIRPASALDHGLVVDAETAHWWTQQSPAARAYLDRAQTEGLALPEALKRFTSFAQAQNDTAGLQIWGKGADFDAPILAAAYAKVGQTPPWLPKANRCYRTLEAMAPFPVPRHTPTGVAHHAGDDAIHQAIQAVRLLRHFQGLAPLPEARPALRAEPMATSRSCHRRPGRS